LAGSKHLSKPTERAPDLSASLTRLILLPYVVRADLGLVERVERVVLRTRRTVISAASASPIVHDCPGDTAGEQRKPLRRKLDCSRFKDRPSGRHLPGGTYCTVSRVVSQMPTGRVCGAARGGDRVHGCCRAGRSDLVAGADLGEVVVLDADAHPGCGSEGRGQDDVQGRPRIPLERLVVCDNTHELGAIHSVIGKRFSSNASTRRRCGMTPS
jgi:hypothetical protein